MKNQKFKKAIVFARVSSKDQEVTGYSLDSQKKLLQQYAKKNKLDVVKEYSISESASGRIQRQRYGEMINYSVKNKIKVLIVEKTDRLTRTVKEGVTISEWLAKDSEREIHLVKEKTVVSETSRNSHDKFMWNVKTAVAQFYADNLSEEVKKGQKEKLAQGWLPTIPPVGYKTIGEKGHKIHEIDNDKAPLVKKMFELYATGNYSTKSLTKKMKSLGLTNKNDRPFAKSSIADLLSKKFYIGINEWKGKEYEGKQETFITEDLFDRVQEVLGSNGGAVKRRKHNYLFKSLMKCEECGGSITWEKQKQFIYGHCNHYRGCQQTAWVREDDIKLIVNKFIGGLRINNETLLDWIREALRASYKDQIETYEVAVTKLNSELDRAQKRLDRLYDDYLDERIAPDFYDRKKKEYEQRKEVVIKDISKYSKSNDKFQQIGMNLYEISQRGDELYDRVDTDGKRELLQLVFKDMGIVNGEAQLVYSEGFLKIKEMVDYMNRSNIEQKLVSEEATFEREETLTGSTSSQFSNALLRVLDSNQQPIG